MAYATVAQLRALDGFASEDDFPDEVLQEAIDQAAETVDDYCGAPHEERPFTVTARGRLSAQLPLVDAKGNPVLFPQTLTSVTIDGEAQTTTDWWLDPEGWLERPTGSFAGDVVVVEGTHGVPGDVPEAISWAVRTLAAQYARDLNARIPDRALQLQSEFGQITLAQAGGAPDRPTSLPDVNARLKRHRHKAPAAF